MSEDIERIEENIKKINRWLGDKDLSPRRRNALLKERFNQIRIKQILESEK